MSSFMRQASANDFQSDEAGNLYVGYNWSDTSCCFRTQIARFDSLGTNSWIMELSSGSGHNGYVRFGPILQTNGYVAAYGDLPNTFPAFKSLWSFDAGGTGVILGSWYSMNNGSGSIFGAEKLYGHAVAGSLGDIFDVELGWLTKFSSSGGVIWSNYVGSVEGILR